MRNTRDDCSMAGRFLLGAAAGTSLYLAVMGLSHTALPGCEAGSRCQEVLQSPWALTFGIPVSFAGFVLYSLTLLWSWAFARRDRTLEALIGSTVLSAVLAAALWFTALQIFVFHALCFWCCVTHGSAVTGAFLLWYSRTGRPVRVPALVCAPDVSGPRTRLSNDYLFRFSSTGLALAATSLMAMGSLWGLPRKPNAEAPSLSAPEVAGNAKNGLPLLGGKYHLDPDDFPAIGPASPDGRTAVLLSDYTCPLCMKYHSVLENVAASARPAVRFIVLPAARTPQAQDIQRTVLTVFHADHAAGRSLSALLTSGQIPAEPDEVNQAALRLLTAEKFESSAQTNADRIHGQIQLAAAILRDSRTSEGGSGMLPQLLCGNGVLAGADNKTATVLAFVESHAPALPRPDPKPLMAVLDSDVDLTALAPGKPHDFQIRIQNKGNAPLKLGWLVLDDGCEVTTMPEKKIYPGEVATVGVRFTPPATGGAFTRRLHIHSDPPGTPESVTLHGSLAPGVAAAPSGKTQ